MRTVSQSRNLTPILESFDYPCNFTSAMASGRTLLCVCTVLLVLLVADVSVAADVPQEAGTVTVASSGLSEKFYLRGDVAGAVTDEASEETFESFARRELGDYGRTPARSNCKVNCNR